MGIPRFVRMDPGALFVLLADMDLASKGDDVAAALASAVMASLRDQGLFQTWRASVDGGELLLRWTPQFPGTEFRASFPVSRLNPAEAAVFAVMAS